MLIKPFMSSVNAQGQAVVRVQHNLHGLVWKIYQLGIALGQVSLLAQAAAHVNGIPLTSTVTMQQSVFSSLPGEAPYAMETFMVGPPYPNLEAGDFITVGVINAIAGDTLTVGAYVDELDRRLGRAQDMGR